MDNSVGPQAAGRTASGSSRTPRQLRLVRSRAVPVVRWVGGKAKLLEKILPLVPARYGRYLEPFCGGAALFFKLRPERALINDTCEDLIEFYREIARDPRKVFEYLGLLTSSLPLASYYVIREEWNERRLSWTPARRAATFLYLNKSCYNGLWRVNRQGGFNVPVGRFGEGGSGDPSYPSLADLVAAGDVLRRAEIYSDGYATIFDRALPGDFLYADPPYVPRSKTSNFTSYGAGGFDEPAQRALASRILALVEKGVQVMVSQSDMPLTREIYAGMTIHEVSGLRSVNSRASGRGPVPELLLTGGFSS